MDGKRIVRTGHASQTELSVLLPVYNCAQFLDEAIQSIRQQPIRCMEIVIVDDGSNDSSSHIIAQHEQSDPRVQCVRIENSGIATALNCGLQHCRGEFVARMDGDDVSEEGRLHAQIEFLRKYGQVGVVGTWAQVIDEAGAGNGSITLPAEHGEIVKQLRVGSYSMLHPTLMFRRRVLEEIGGYDAQFRYAEDLDLLLRLSERTQLANIPELLLRYRRRRASMSDVGLNQYPHWDFRALECAKARGSHIRDKSLAASAERVSWTELSKGDIAAARKWAWKALGYAPLSAIGYRAMARIVARSARRSTLIGGAKV